MSEEEKNVPKISRRQFVTGAAASVAAVTAGSVLAGCSPKVAETLAPVQAASTAVPAAASTVAPVQAASAPAATGTRPSGYMCDSDWLGKAPVIADADIAQTVTVDVVVCGGGHSGTQAALAAAQLGKTVAVIEKQAADKYTYKGDDICSYNSKFMIDRGFGPYDTGEIVAEYVKRAAGRCSPEVISLFVENSGEMMDNMVSLVPGTSNLLDIENEQAIIQIAYGKPKGTDYPIQQGGYKSWATTLQTIGTTNPTPVNGRDGLSRLTELKLM